ncbi:hypothetical protein HDU96_000468, partial [Phlyctochytrium bullatum]
PAPTNPQLTGHVYDRTTERVRKGEFTRDDVKNVQKSTVAAYDNVEKGPVLITPKQNGNGYVAMPVSKDGNAKTVFQASQNSALGQVYRTQTSKPSTNTKKTLYSDEVDGEEFESDEFDADELEGEELDGEELDGEELEGDEVDAEELEDEM